MSPKGRPSPKAAAALDRRFRRRRAGGDHGDDLDRARHAGCAGGEQVADVLQARRQCPLSRQRLHRRHATAVRVGGGVVDITRSPEAKRGHREVALARSAVLPSGRSCRANRPARTGCRRGMMAARERGLRIAEDRHTMLTRCRSRRPMLEDRHRDADVALADRCRDHSCYPAAIALAPRMLEHGATMLWRGRHPVP